MPDPHTATSTYIALTVFFFLVAIGFCILASIIVAVTRHVRRIKNRGNINSSAPCPIGHRASQKIKRRLCELVSRNMDICTEPKVFTEYYERHFDSLALDPENSFIWRMKAVDCLQQLETEIRKVDDSKPSLRRKPGTSLRDFLAALHRLVFVQASLADIRKLGELHDHALHDPDPFKVEHYEEYRELVERLSEVVRRYRSEPLIGIQPSVLPSRDSMQHLVASSSSAASNAIEMKRLSGDKVDGRKLLEDTGSSVRRISQGSDDSQTALIEMDNTVENDVVFMGSTRRLTSIC